jgi:hypothetical protein
MRGGDDMNIFKSLIDLVPTLINRVSNRHTGKGLLVLMTMIGLEAGADLDQLEQIFDGVEQDPIKLIFYLGIYLVIHYVKKD